MVWAWAVPKAERAFFYGSRWPRPRPGRPEGGLEAGRHGGLEASSLHARSTGLRTHMYLQVGICRTGQPNPRSSHSRHNSRQAARSHAGSPGVVLVIIVSSPTTIPSGIPGGTLLPVYYVPPYQFVTCMRWHTRVPTHTRTEHLYQKMNLRNGIEQNATRQTTRRHQTTHRKWSQGTDTRNLNQQQKE